MDRIGRSRPGQRMTRMFLAGRGGRPSRTAAWGALLAVAALAALAASLIGGGSALAHRGLGQPVLVGEPAPAVHTLAEPPAEATPVPPIPADAQDAQPIATF
ncbi:hypothetical protein ACPWT1_20110 [Ramlibacter sp. MMS24-I3-19]|uniref:hypothetical protein n=1 Tax=Ramlibacter sp. MMS24-I3-19 TaxID=3416606 RepID=UPI003D09011B